MASIRDIANRKLVEDALQRQALTDPLTGLANRTVFMDRLSQGLLRLERSPTLIGVIYLDLDRFKCINDSLGHELGDRLLAQEADLALYRAKGRGRNRAEVFDEELRTTAVGRLGVERMIRNAIDEDLLRVQYQPIVDLRTGQVVLAEALVRIQGPEELIPPALFLDIAETSG